MLNIKYLFALIGLIAAIAFMVVFASHAEQKPVEEGSCFYLRSLHYTASGMAHWYSKENGGLEQLTGVPYSELGCKNCYAAGCDSCHKTGTVEGDCKTLSYSIRSRKSNSTP